ncbi:MAG: bestrophin family protein [Nannocystales bacterium]
MIIEKRSWFRSLAAVRGTSLPRTWLRLFVTVLFAVVVTVLNETGRIGATRSPLPFSLIGVALGIFLGFRNNTAYDRFWEGRKLWGRMVNVSRSLTRQIQMMVGPQPGEPVDSAARAAVHRELVHRIVAYVHVFRHHLRNEPDLSDVVGHLPQDEVQALDGESNRPTAVTARTGERLRELWDRGWIHPMHLPVLEASLTEMTGIQGGCERIKATPIPASYTILIHRIVATYAFALPLGIVDITHGWTPVVVLLIAYAFYGLDAIGDEIEEPFGFDENDLPLSTLSRMIEVNVRQRLGETELPPLLEPEGGILR